MLIFPTAINLFLLLRILLNNSFYEFGVLRVESEVSFKLKVKSEIYDNIRLPAV